MSGKVILIAGPTASGKSGLALALAEKIGGTVINADSMQVYRELEVLTARPTAEDRRRAPHLLYGHVAGAEPYSAGRYAREAAAAIASAHAEGRMPILVGGTGLYFKALLEGLSPIPPIPEEVRRHWRAEAARLGSAALHALLAARDPEMAHRLGPTDPQRVTRALEVLDATGRSLADWHALPGEPVVREDEALPLVVKLPRDELYARCNARFGAMMEAGAEEVRALSALDLDPELPVMRALGVRPIRDYLEGRIGREEAVAQAQAETRQYAKRQLTWLKSNMSSWKAVSTQQTESIHCDIVAFIR